MVISKRCQRTRDDQKVERQVFPRRQDHLTNVSVSIQLFSAVKNVNGDDQINRRISDMTLLLDDGEDDNDDDDDDDDDDEHNGDDEDALYLGRKIAR